MPKAKAPAPAKKPAAKPAAEQMYMLSETELGNLTKYVVSLSRHNLSGEEYLSVLGAVQAARQRPVAKD